MPEARIRGVRINYEVLGSQGPWMALSPGGRRPLQGVKPLARRMADAGYRVVIHDRRNCGASEVTIGHKDPENEMWADDLHELLRQLGALPVIIGGGSSGCRLAILFTLRYPKLVEALLLWRITGGRFAAERLARQYYTQYIEAAEAGGMAAVCATEHWQERIAARPTNGEYLLKMDAKRFIEAMSRWREYFLQGAELPIIGASEADLKSITVPACVIPGNDRTHDLKTGRNLARLLPRGELHPLFDKDEDADLVAPEEWQKKDDEIAAIFTGFLKRAFAPARALGS